VNDPRRQNLTARAGELSVGSHRVKALAHLNQKELATRWSMSCRTLEAWRTRRKGPPYLKLGGRIAYRLVDIEQFEQERLHGPSAPRAEGGQ
jgi:hypothetical protein